MLRCDRACSGNCHTWRPTAQEVGIGQPHCRNHVGPGPVEFAVRLPRRWLKSLDRQHPTKMLWGIKDTCVACVHSFLIA